MNKVSNCCGAEDGMATYDGPSWSDIGICPDCRDHCEFEEDEGEDVEKTTNQTRNPIDTNAKPNP